ncbi:MAG: lysostaphin resistance A-like protein, partial [Halobacteriaceae archaeon]
LAAVIFAAGIVLASRPVLGRALYWGGLLTFLVAPLVTFLAGTEPAANRAGLTAFENPEIIPWLVPPMLLVLGPGEELLFRGIIQGSLRERFSAPAAIVLAGLMFAPAHITALAGSPEAVLVTITILFVPSLVFGAVYEHTDNIVVPSLVHGLYNSTLLVLLYVAATSGMAPGAG